VILEGEGVKPASTGEPVSCAVCRLEAVDRDTKDLAVRCFLLGALRRADSTLPTYGDLAKLFGGAPNGQGPLLERVAQQCAERDEPDLTVLVVNRSGLSRKFEGLEVQPDTSAVDRWRAAVKAAREFSWSNTGL
jgi:hypothetical protein